MAIKLTAYNCQLECGISVPAIAEAFVPHQRFDIVLTFDTLNAGKITFADTVSKVEFLMFAFSSYVRNGKWIRVDNPFSVSIWCADGVICVDPSMEPVKSYSERLDERAENILNSLLEGLDGNECGQDISSDGFTILEATYYSDDAGNNFRPYWSCCLQAPDGKVVTLSSHADLKKFIRENL